jgi:Domain of unknown function (DUF4261)
MKPIEETSADNPRSTALAMVALTAPQCLDPDSILAKLQASLLNFSDFEHKDGAATCRIPGGQVGWVPMPVPIPWSDLEWPCQAASWIWPEAVEVMSAHQAHFVVFGSSTELDRVEVALAVTQVVAAVADCTPACGVYWGEASLVVEVNQFIEMAREGSREEPPVLLWIGVHPVTSTDGVSAYTTGLQSFGHVELEAHDSGQAEPDLLRQLVEVSFYILSSDAKLKDGDTFGEDELDRRPIRHVLSRYLEGKIVCLLPF